MHFNRNKCKLQLLVQVINCIYVGNEESESNLCPRDTRNLKVQTRNLIFFKDYVPCIHKMEYWSFITGNDQLLVDTGVLYYIVKQRKTNAGAKQYVYLVFTQFLFKKKKNLKNRQKLRLVFFCKSFIFYIMNIYFLYPFLSSLTKQIKLEEVFRRRRSL